MPIHTAASTPAPPSDAAIITTLGGPAFLAGTGFGAALGMSDVGVGDDGVTTEVVEEVTEVVEVKRVVVGLVTVVTGAVEVRVTVSIATGEIEHTRRGGGGRGINIRSVATPVSVTTSTVV